MIIFNMIFSGYLAFGNTTSDNILNSFQSTTFFSLSILFKILIVIHLLFYIPQEFIVMRNSLYEIIFVDHKQTSDILHGCITLYIILQGIGIACYLLNSTKNGFHIVISLSGGICWSIIVFILPGIIGILLGNNSLQGESTMRIKATDGDHSTSSEEPSSKDYKNDLTILTSGVFLLVIGLVLFFYTIISVFL